jgi:superfamily II DNA or RNA helicase
MTQSVGYIYIRSHPAYDTYDACKMGKTDSIHERDTQYATGEIKRGNFEPVFEVPIKQMSMVENLLKVKFSKFNVRIDGGTEFFNKKIITLIEPYLTKLGIQCRRLSEQEIKRLNRKYRIQKLLKRLIQKITNQEIAPYVQSQRQSLLDARDEKLLSFSFVPREDQIAIIETSVAYFSEQMQKDSVFDLLSLKDNKGLLIIPCGVGKTLISLWITKRLNSNKILIGVPNKLLLKQWGKIISLFFQDVQYLVVSGGVDVDNISQFLQMNNESCIVITTYSSAHKVYTATQQTQFVFDMKLNDECHHLTNYNMEIANNKKSYIQMLNIESRKQLSLTATIKELDNDINSDKVIANNNKEYFGEIIERKCLLWAINISVVCDYFIQTIITDEDQIEEHFEKFGISEETDKRLFLSAFSSLKSIFEGHSHHLLIYSNNKENSLKLIEYIKLLLDNYYFDLPDLYFSNYHSFMKSKKQKEILHKFEESTFGIITCVYCLGEGWDFPKLDAVVFSENMSSNIRIVQSALRASRKNKDEPAKITKIILPVLNRDDWLEDNENNDLKKVREVIYQMGLEDETIAQKIKVYRVVVEKQRKKKSDKEEPEQKTVDDLGEYDELLTQKLRLKTISRSSLGITYEKARKIISEKSVSSKRDYYDLCDRDIRLPKEPENHFKGKFTNWIEYLSIPRIYYDLETCKKKATEHLLKNPELKKNYMNLSVACSELCKIDRMFPPCDLWVEYYNMKELSNIIIITNKKKSSGLGLK